MDWVQGLDMKLREMHILSPKENVYTKPPESRPPLLPTRDPNSPLPLPPLRDLPSNILPGVEPVTVAQSISIDSHKKLEYYVILINIYFSISDRDEAASSEIDQIFLTPPISPNPMLVKYCL